MRKRLLSLCILIGISLMGCSAKATTSKVETPELTVNVEIPQYKGMTYEQFREHTGTDLEQYFSFYYFAPIPNTELDLVYRANKYDEELIKNVLQEDDISYRVEGKLGAMFDGFTTEMSLEDFLEALSWNQQIPECEMKEGAGTAYYVGNLYAEIHIDSDGDAVKDMLLQICFDYSDCVGPDSRAWLSWKSEE